MVAVVDLISGMTFDVEAEAEPVPRILIIFKICHVMWGKTSDTWFWATSTNLEISTLEAIFSQMAAMVATTAELPVVDAPSEPKVETINSGKGGMLHSRVHIEAGDLVIVFMVSVAAVTLCDC